MKILIKSGTTEHTLCHGHITGTDKHVGPSDLLCSGPVSVEIGRYIRATAAIPYNRANRVSTISFSVTRECASALAAELFCLTHLRDLLREGTLYIHAQSAAGGTEQITLSNAIVQDVQCRHVGLTVLVAYQIVGGTIS
jgi:hypothetical protein